MMIERWDTYILGCYKIRNDMPFITCQFQSFYNLLQWFFCRSLKTFVEFMFKIVKLSI